MQSSTAVELSPRVACFTPLPPAKTGIANYAAGLLPHLRDHVDLEVYVDQRRVECPTVTGKMPVDHLLRFPLRASEYDLLLYEMGNSSAHAGMFELMLHYPGIVHLHDLVLHHFHLEFYFHRGRARDYARKLRSLHGREGSTLARCVLNDFGGSLGYFELPMRDEVIRRSVGVVVHSRWAQRVLRRDFPSLPILQIGHPCFTHTLGETDGAGFRRRFGIPADAFVVASLGFATPAKRIDKLLEAVALLCDEIPKLRLLVVGELNPAAGLAERAAEFGVAERMIATGWVDDRELWNAIEASDVVASLRFPTAGEASGPLMQAMSVGRPVLVTALRQFLDLPEAVCMRIPLGAAEVPVLTDRIRELARAPELRRRLGAAARRFAAEDASPERAARSVAAFLRALLPLSRMRLRAASERMRDARCRVAGSLSRRAFRGLTAGLPEEAVRAAAGIEGPPFGPAVE